MALFTFKRQRSVGHQFLKNNPNSSALNTSLGECSFKIFGKTFCHKQTLFNNKFVDTRYHAFSRIDRSSGFINTEAFSNVMRFFDDNVMNVQNHLNKTVFLVIAMFYFFVVYNYAAGIAGLLGQNERPGKTGDNFITILVVNNQRRQTLFNLEL